MKKLFFTALVAAVAIGGAYATNSTSDKLVILAKPAGSAGPCNTTVVPCNTASGPACTINDITYARQNPVTGLCTIPLFRDANP
ncbi:hypothetical protein [Pedobacter nyackensis]|uniref:hypothetical protein n=1 Tax=Pedobacter nyackensis TaxID=475255 RepID=UPI00292E59BA|nr:hypothetical protein [Pedobacter nyackensis]